MRTFNARMFNSAVREETTREWVEYLSKPENRTGFMWNVAKRGILPAGVNADDLRVIAILKED